MSPCPTVLLFGQDALLLHIRTLVLERNGIAAGWTTGLDQVARILGDGRLQLLILCHTVREPECGQALAAVHALSPATRTLALHSVLPSCTVGKVDRILDIFEGPLLLVQNVRELMDDPPPSRLPVSDAQEKVRMEAFLNL